MEAAEKKKIRFADNAKREISPYILWWRFYIIENIFHSNNAISNILLILKIPLNLNAEKCAVILKSQMKFEKLLLFFSVFMVLKYSLYFSVTIIFEFVWHDRFNVEKNSVDWDYY